LQKLVKIAVATNNQNGLDDVVAKVFGRAKTFTIIDAEDEKIVNVKVLENSAANYHHGAGPITVKMLIDEGVNIVVANELGLGASELLKQHNIRHVPMKPNTKVQTAIQNVITNKVEKELEEYSNSRYIY
jgi:predicted Fe-Mo cluster-binding NifX family protein